tara:strand:- start:795 stop:1034 length:240 start_codon:yes stop_codon:yes gene_type:complete
MSRYVVKSKHIELHYGYDEQIGEWWFQVYDNARKQIEDGLVDEGGTKTTNLTPIELAERLKKFEAPVEHIQKILWRKKI